MDTCRKKAPYFLITRNKQFKHLSKNAQNNLKSRCFFLVIEHILKK